MSDRLAERIREALDGGLPLLHREDRLARRKTAEDAIDALVEVAKAARALERGGLIPEFDEVLAPLRAALSALDGEA